VEDGLRTAGVAKSTYYDWLTDPAFRAEYNRQESVLIDTALTSLKSLVVRAVNTLEELLDKGPAAVRLRAAVTVLERAVPVLTMERALTRLELFEEVIGELKKTGEVA
jgi:hypothetical protein